MTDPLAPARGVLVGLLAGSIIWLVVGAILVWWSST